MRLGEFRTKTKNLDNRYVLRVSNYEDGTVYEDLEIDIVTKDAIYLRRVKKEWLILMKRTEDSTKDS